MMNSCRSTCRICWSVGMLTARAVSRARSTSSVLTSRSFTATMPVELKLRMWLPAIPTNAEAILQSAMSSASSSARWIAATVASMVTTTPFFRPLDSWLPMPSMARVPSGSTSPTRHATLEVPMSRATMRFLFSLAISLLAAPVGHAHGVAVRIAQVDVLVRPALRIALDVAAQARLGRIGIAAEHEVLPVREAQLPGLARTEHHALDRRAERRHDFGKAPITPRDLSRGSRRRDKKGQRLLAPGQEGLAVGV